ncbi:TIR-like protein FxsC [Micromonospora sp. NPDC050417]|uniref:TIR-like protein FxsC n=1 Tax=Micromonospora sp. NPDC050417 TaxID=3364280 RepID=UPI0037959CDC
MYFFLSYARGDDDVYVKKFFDELSKEVRNLTGDQPDYEVGFLDVRGIPLGASWSPELINALSTCRVFISLCSPGYFRRPACGREWQVFASRLADHERETGVRAPALMPLVWTPMADMPELASRLQYHTESLGDAYRQQGLRQLVRLNRRGPLLRLVSSLAEKIVATAKGYRLPTPAPMTNFDEITSAFAVPVATPREVDASTASSRYVHFVVAAPTRTEVAVLRRNGDFYGDSFDDWAPYRPSLEDPLALYARSIAERHRFDSEIASLEDLSERIDRANQNNQVVVLLVDAWVARLAEQREVLRSYDQRNEPTTGVLIPVSSGDPQTDEHGSELVEELLVALANNNIRGDTMFRPRIQTHGDFDVDLQNVLEEAQNRIYRRGRARRLPTGELPGERPILEGP